MVHQAPVKTEAMKKLISQPPAVFYVKSEAKPTANWQALVAFSFLQSVGSKSSVDLLVERGPHSTNGCFQEFSSARFQAFESY